MARYFFHLCDGDDLLIDPDGQDVDAADIPAMALKEARWCISQDALEGRINLLQAIEVRDSSGSLIHRINFQDAVTISAKP